MGKIAPAVPRRDPAFARAVEILDSLIRRLLCSGWDETLRRQAISAAAQAITIDGGPEPRQARKLCRSILSLLALQGGDSEELRGDIGARLLELLARLGRPGAQGLEE